MANITLTLPADVIRDARVMAAQRDTSVSGLILELLKPLAGSERSYDQVWDDEAETMEKGLYRVDAHLPRRDDLHLR